jgi:DNA-binding response OmpR family regulator
MGSTTNRHHILVVDDDEDGADLLAESLRDRGIDARVAHDAKTALDLSDGFTADVAVIDLGLPDMDGFELARRLREHPALQRIRLVALTGLADRDTRSRAVAAGFDEHLVKPVRFETLEDVIEKLTS